MRGKKKRWNKRTLAKPLRLIFGRTGYMMASVLLQILVLAIAFKWLSNQMFFVYGGLNLLSVGVVIYIINKPDNPSFKLAWIIPILAFPVFGVMFYIFVESQLGTRVLSNWLKEIIKGSSKYLEQDEAVLGRLYNESRGTAHLAMYMNQYGGYPVYDHTQAEYFSLGDTMYQKMLEKLRDAKHYIFLEYFIIERGEMWDSILEILKQKVQEGVEVRVLYDGWCSLMILPHGYPRLLKEMGIQCKMFSPVRPALSSVQNNRDHRKIMVIDGHTAFTGGINLADEYINRKERFGHWKDTGVMIEGDAVTSFVIMFLQMWNVSETEECYEAYLPTEQGTGTLRRETDGYVMPYGDSPLDDETTGKNVYLDILNEARYYVHIMTPYLILDSEMITALTFAAKRGIEVIIIMPHIPDKVYAYWLARSYYEELLTAGVKIYEYTPGFVHAKIFSSDHTKAVVGSINLDYRSLHLHFECATYLFRNHAVMQVEEDFQETLKQCQEITIENCKNYPFLKQFAGKALRLIAPLM